MLLLNPEQHRDLHLTPIDNGWLALGQGAIPLVFDDLQTLKGRCPVVISQRGTPLPLLLPELIQRYQSASWGGFTPKALKPYPLRLIRQPVLAAGDTQLEYRESLMIDESSPHLQLRTGYRLFEDDGQLTAFTQEKIQQLRAFESELQQVQQLMQQLDDIGALAPVRVLYQGETIDCRLIHRERLNAALGQLDSLEAGYHVVFLAEALLQAQDCLDVDQVHWMEESDSAHYKPSRSAVRKAMLNNDDGEVDR